MKEGKQKTKRTKNITSPLKQKILLMLGAGVLLGFSYSPQHYFKILRAVIKEWRFIERRYLFQLIREFKRDRLVEYRESFNGETKIILTEQGKKVVLFFDLDKIKIQKPSVWDGKWRIVMFDIPEKKRNARDALRDKLKELGFQEVQRSVFIHPFPCNKEISFIVEVFEIRNCVRLAEVDKISNEAELLIKFNLRKKLKV
ncbi:MAG: CRISPR-associated endonuclease Cas2 [Candidatus Vogelbacteria bacterium]